MVRGEWIGSYLGDRINRSCLLGDLLERSCRNSSDRDFLLEQEARSFAQMGLGEVGCAVL